MWVRKASTKSNFFALFHVPRVGVPELGCNAGNNTQGFSSIILYRSITLKPDIINIAFSEIFEMLGIGKVPNNSRTLLSATACTRGNSRKYCAAVRIFPTPPKIKHRRKNEAALFSDKQCPRNSEKFGHFLQYSVSINGWV